MTELEHEQGSCHSPSAGVLRTSEYAGSREGTPLPPSSSGVAMKATLSSTRTTRQDYCSSSGCP